MPKRRWSVRSRRTNELAWFGAGTRAGTPLALEVVAEAANGHEAVRKAAECRPDIVLLDVTMPDSGGLEALAALPASVRTLMLSAYAEED